MIPFWYESGCFAEEQISWESLLITWVCCFCSIFCIFSHWFVVLDLIGCDFLFCIMLLWLFWITCIIYIYIWLVGENLESREDIEMYWWILSRKRRYCEASHNVEGYNVLTTSESFFGGYASMQWSFIFESIISTTHRFVFFNLNAC